MDTRKVIKHGPSTLIMSLPAQWVKANHVQKGDDLSVEQNGRELLVSTEAKTPHQRIEQDVTDFTPFLVTRLLARNYQKGFDEIRLVHDNPALFEAIRDKTQDLMGFEITEQDNSSVTIQAVTKELELDFDDTLRKAFRITNQMLTDLQEAYAAGNQDKLRAVHYKDLQVNQFTYYCLRQINKQRHADPALRHQSYVLYYLVELLEDLADSFVTLADGLADELPPRDEVKDILQGVADFYQKSYEFFYKPQLETATDAMQDYRRLREDIKQCCTDTPTAVVLDLDAAVRAIYHFTTMRLDFIDKDQRDE